MPMRARISVTPTTPLSNRRERSPGDALGVAFAGLAIEHDRSLAAETTPRSYLAGVIIDGTAALGVGDAGPRARIFRRPPQGPGPASGPV
jgi:malic enzyme